MRKTIFLLVALVSAVIQSEAQNKKLLMAGTDVPVVAEKDIKASELKEGQTIELVTADDVKVESGEVVIPKGSQHVVDTVFRIYDF
jgi:sulfate adenylyltransferase subunit 1 (EFTu-like GTPase family)